MLDLFNEAVHKRVAGEKVFVKVLDEIYQRQEQEIARYAGEVQTLQIRLAAANQYIAELQQQLRCNNFDFVPSPIDGALVKEEHVDVTGTDGSADAPKEESRDENYKDIFSNITTEELVDYDSDLNPVRALDSDTLDTEASDEGNAAQVETELPSTKKAHINRAAGASKPKQRKRKISGGRKRRSFQCPFCNKTFNFWSALKRRVLLDSGEKAYSCKECKEKHNLLSASHAYQKPVDVERPHECKICHIAFTQRKTLVNHVRFHTGERPFGCQICKRSFARIDYLKGHLKIHNDEIKYSCCVCSLKFRESRLLRLHLRNCHQIGDDVDIE